MAVSAQTVCPEGSSPRAEHVAAPEPHDPGSRTRVEDAEPLGWIAALCSGSNPGGRSQSRLSLLAGLIAGGMLRAAEDLADASGCEAGSEFAFGAGGASR